MQSAGRFLQVILISAALFACASDDTFAPVADIATIQPIPASGKYAVSTRESLYEIAWRYGLDYNELALRNHISPPYRVYAGETVYLRGYAPVSEPSRVVVTFQPEVKPYRKPIIISTIKPALKPAVKLVAHSKVVVKPKLVVLKNIPDPILSKTWAWPAHGKVITKFAGLNKGINIAGRIGDSVYAVNAGRVVYNGTGLRGYGNLIIIKHNSEFMSAYAHNSLVLVEEGEVVKRGQKIAEIGNSGSDRVMLHFEIRRYGKPVNPINTLKSR